MTTNENTTTDSAYVPSEAEVEAGARALWANQGMVFDWDRVLPETKDGFRTLARAALVAARTVAPTPPTDMVPAAALADRAWAERFLAEWSKPYFGDDSPDAVAAVLRAATAARTAPTTEGDPS